MQTALGILLVVLGVALIAAILLQSGRAAGLSGAITGAGESFFGKKKGLDDFLSRLTVVLVTLFLLVALVTSYLQRV